MRISDWSSDVCSSDLVTRPPPPTASRSGAPRRRWRQRRRKSIGANAISMATSASRKPLFRHRSALPQWRPVIAAANLGAMTEAEFLAALRTLPLHPGAQGLRDDVAHLGDLILTTDTIVEGVHYLAREQIGRASCRERVCTYV